MRSQDCFVTLAALLATASAAAGVIVTQVQEHSGQATHPGAPGNSHTEMELSAEGNGLRQDIIRSDSAMMPAGCYLLYPTDQLMYLVNPSNKTYSMLDMAAISGMQRQGPQQAGAGNPPVAADKLVIDKKVDESGPVMLGLPTQHVVYEVSYQRPPAVQIPGFVSSMEVHERYEIWATNGLEARVAEVPALKRSVVSMGALGGGGPGLKPVSDALASHGFILKQVVTSESKTGGAPGPMSLLMHMRSQKETRSSVVTAIRYEPLQPERFALPKGYAEVAMMNSNMGAGAMPDLSNLPGRPGGPPGPGGPSQPGAAPQPPAAAPGAPPPPPPSMPDLNDIPK
ncbi:MAG TPA: hypothetical protein VGP32_08605 [Steroidobacteraceae bacterium]|jgi:hypothetical protein|nr:hypothetical protein [Steroidobacteraceae bacterium]